MANNTQKQQTTMHECTTGVLFSFEAVKDSSSSLYFIHFHNHINPVHFSSGITHVLYTVNRYHHRGANTVSNFAIKAR